MEFSQAETKPLITTFRHSSQPYALRATSGISTPLAKHRPSHDLDRIAIRIIATDLTFTILFAVIQWHSDSVCIEFLYPCSRHQNAWLDRAVPAHESGRLGRHLQHSHIHTMGQLGDISPEGSIAASPSRKFCLGHAANLHLDRDHSRPAINLSPISGIDPPAQVPYHRRCKR